MLYFCSLELQSSQELQSISKLIHVIVERLDSLWAIRQESQFLSGYWLETFLSSFPMYFSIEQLLPWKPQSEWSKRGKEEETKRERMSKTEITVFYNLHLKTAYHHFSHNLLVTRPTLVQCETRLLTVWIPGGRNYWGLSWRLDSTGCILKNYGEYPPRKDYLHIWESVYSTIIY